MKTSKDNMKKLFVHTFGCKVNIYESEVIKDIFLKDGYGIAKSASVADVVVINTCTVTEKADHKFLHLLKKIRMENPSAVIISLGCFTQLESENEVLKADSNIILGVNNKYDIIEALNVYKGNSFVAVPENHDLDYADHELRSFQDHTRAFLKVQDGCDNFCTFCIVPMVRGRAVSRPANEILENIRKVVYHGYKEVVLTGVNISRYDYGGLDFTGLLKEILEMEGNFRVRISSIEPEGFGEAMYTLFSHPKLCPHLHKNFVGTTLQTQVQMRA